MASFSYPHFFSLIVDKPRRRRHTTSTRYTRLTSSSEPTLLDFVLRVVFVAALRLAAADFLPLPVGLLCNASGCLVKTAMALRILLLLGGPWNGANKATAGWGDDDV